MHLRICAYSKTVNIVQSFFLYWRWIHSEEKEKVIWHVSLSFEVVFEMRSGIFEVSVSIDPNMVPIS